MTSASLRILVVEDDYLTAKRLSHEIQANGDTVVGPFADVHDAMPYVGLVQAAILDVKVRDETSFQVADSLVQHDLPFVFLTGYDPKVVPSRFARRHIYTKPSQAAALLHDLHQRHREIAPAEEESVEAILIEMIRQSHRLMLDPSAAERLVEAAMLRAIAEAREGRMQENIRARLLGLLDDEYQKRGKAHLQ
jgi:DNA-binding LytR/AlgR family response regulator